MPNFTFTGPEGKSYTVAGPDGATPEQAFQILQQHLGGAPAAPPPDKYQQAALDEQSALKAAGGDPGSGLTRRLAHGATLGADSTILAGLETPLEMIKRGTFNPAEGYNYAKAREDQIMSDARQNTGMLGTGAEILGGAVTGGNLAGGVGSMMRGAAGNIATRAAPALSTGSMLAPGAGLLARAGSSAADAAAFGGFSGAMEGNGLQERIQNALKGAGTGVLVGGALPVAGAVASAAFKPITSNIRARLNPEGYAQSQVARAMSESGQAPAAVDAALQSARGEGQGVFNVADAMGDAGQNLLGVAARGPGTARTAIFNALEGRQGTQGRRISNALSEGFQAPETAAQTEARMTAARDAAANTDFSAVRAGPEQPNFPIAETPRERTFRTGYDNIVRVDAAKLQQQAAKNATGGLTINPAKLAAVRKSGSGDGYPRIDVTGDKVSIEDGVHRTAVAGERGQTIDVAVKTPDEAAALRKIAAPQSGPRPVDVVPAINHIDSIIGTQPGQMLTPSNDSTEGILTAFRQRLSRVNPDDFQAVQRIRGEMSDAAQNAGQNGFGDRRRLIKQALQHLDASMEAASSGYKAANAKYAQSSRNIEAVQTGRQAQAQGRIEDTIPRFQALPPEGQQAFRAGYVDKPIADAQGAAFGANKARPLMNDAFQTEAGVMAPGNDLMQRRIGRENTMFETRATALGGSSTAKNLAHDAAAGVTPELVLNAVTGNVHGAVRNILSAGKNMMTGNTPAVRQQIANVLLRNGSNLAPGELHRMIQSTVAQIQFYQNIARNLGRGASAGLAVEGPGRQR